MHKYSIYKLINPIDNSVFYVGITNQELSKRLGCHISESISSSYHCMSKKQMIIFHIINCGLRPVIELIESVESNNAEETYKLARKKEDEWIDNHNNSGIILTNKSTDEQKNYNEMAKLPSDEWEIMFSKYLHDNISFKKKLFESICNNKSVIVCSGEIIPQSVFYQQSNIKKVIELQEKMISEVEHFIITKRETLFLENKAIEELVSPNISKERIDRIIDQLLILQQIETIMLKYSLDAEDHLYEIND